jgi:small-conductance mechanosensitive channel
MTDWWHQVGLSQVFTAERLLGLVRALTVIVLGLILARLAASSLGRAFRNRLAAQEAVLARRLVYYALVALVLAMALHQLGFQLGVLLGAAGVLTVALGFASQTSASNLISGLFLIAERPFAVGDSITVDNITGDVVSIDLLSVKIRTWDNLFVRVPNESIIKSNVINITRYPIRRTDMHIGVAYKEDIDRVRRILFEVAEENPLCLIQPKPFFLFRRFGDSALEIQFSVWSARENYVALRNSIHEEIKRAFDAHGVEIPFPHRSLYAGSVTGPFPVQLVPPEDDVPDEVGS